MLTAHPQVSAAVVTCDGETLTAYLTPTTTPTGTAHTAQSDQLERWRGVFADVDENAVADDVTFDITGWDSSFSGAPIAAVEMREWVDTTVARIRALDARRVLEIGCGSGLLTWRVAPHSERYLALDFSPATVSQLSSALAGAGVLNTEVRVGEANDLSAVDERFDAIVINSVAQYFPDESYLRSVMAQAADLLAPGGTLMLGDIRHLGLLDDFYTAVELERCVPNDRAGVLRARIAARAAREEELVIDPAFFTAWVAERPGAWQVRVAPRRGIHWNEMTAYRYDAFLVREPAGAPIRVAEWRQWPEGADADWVRALLRGSPETPVGLRGCPNARLVAAREAAAVLAATADEDTLDPGAATSVSALPGGIHPEELEAIAAAAGVRLELSWMSASQPVGDFDAAFLPAGMPGHANFDRWPAESGRRLINDPAAAVARSARSGELLRDVRALVSERLPQYMRPAAYVVLDALPLGPNGKVDRAALPAAPPAEEDHTDYLAPVGPWQTAVAGTFAEVLGLDRVGAGADFFVLGGHSLLATQVAARLRAALDLPVGVRDVFEHPNVSALADHLSVMAGLPSPIAPAPVRSADAGGEPGAAAAGGPLSHAQARLHFLQHLDSSGGQYHLWSVLDLGAHPEPAADALSTRLGDALSAVVARHAALRTRILDGAEPRQVVDAPAPLTLRRLDAAGPDAARRLARAEVETAFDLTTEWPIRATLISDAVGGRLLVLTIHHIASDGWSHTIFKRDLARAFAGEDLAGNSETPAATYAEFAVWQNERATERRDADLAFWEGRLVDLNPAEIVTDHPRAGVSAGPAVTVATELAPSVMSALRDRCAEGSATPFMAMLALWQIVVSRWGGEADVTVASPVANREDPQLQELVGFLVNTLIFDATIDERLSFTEQLAQTRIAVLEALAHAETPFDVVVEELAPTRELGRTPLYQSMFSYAAGDGDDWTLGELTVREETIAPARAKADLSLDVIDRGDRVAVELVYRGDLFEADTADGLLHAFRALAGWVGEHPDRPLSEMPLSSDSAPQLTGPDPGLTPEDDLLDTLKRTAAARGGGPAILFGAAHLTYAEVQRRVDDLAAQVHGAGLGQGEPVAVMLERSPECIIAALAVIRAGGAYLPVDPRLPDARLSFIAADARPGLVISDRTHMTRWPGAGRVLDVGASHPQGAAPPARRSDSAAYVIYTSGSTGEPKGVRISYASLSARIAGMQAQFPLGPDDRLLAKTPPSFDVSLWEICWPLAAGAATVVLPAGAEADPDALAEAIATHRVTVAHFVPSMLAAFTAAYRGRRLDTLRRLFSGGEVLAHGLVDTVSKALPGVELVNLYGPAEATIDVTAHVCVAGADRVPIGVPLAGVQAYVRDRYGRDAAAGMAGELLLGGSQLAIDYLGRPDLTAASFITDPRTGTRLYRTGDIVRSRVGGELEYLRRRDAQMKVRGVRLEPAEVEAALTSLPGVRDAAVAVRDPRSPRATLVGFVVATAPDPDLAELAARARAALPAHLVPTTLSALPGLPRTASGKLDRRALSRLVGETDWVAPQRVGSGSPLSPDQLVVAEAAASVLKLTDLPDLDADFFSLGGHSLQAVALTVALRERGFSRVGVADVFEGRTVSGIAARLMTGPAAAVTPADSGPGSGSIVRLSPPFDGPLVALIHPIGGGIGCYAPVARALADHGCEAELVALQAVGLEGERAPVGDIETMAGAYLDELRQACQRLPDVLVGWSFGGTLAFEMARRLRGDGEQPSLVLLDSLPPGGYEVPDTTAREGWLADLAAVGIVPTGLDDATLEARVAVYGANRAAALRYRSAPAPLTGVLWRTAQAARRVDTAWADLLHGGVEIHELAGGHYDVMSAHNLVAWTGRLAASLQLQQPTHGSDLSPATTEE